MTIILRQKACKKLVYYWAITVFDTRTHKRYRSGKIGDQSKSPGPLIKVPHYGCGWLPQSLFVF